MFHAAGEQVVGDGLAAFFMETGGQIGFGQMACGGDSIGEAWFCLGMDGGLEGAGARARVPSQVCMEAARASWFCREKFRTQSIYWQA